jgi:hypothetical protein
MYAFLVYEIDEWVERLPLLEMNGLVVRNMKDSGCKMARPRCAAETFKKANENVNRFEHHSTAFVHEGLYSCSLH